ncbi:P-loop containing nucleoside triphosphate hydrolase protein [Athelia psychrophila]|uniref:P-loop containing nucleoside triphosphate hydrolase protein n=1 Tax=Athelia psychrophila TaxID=1759441 RepID=A0A166J3T2_9AGAM|nr:P-loop containing nucleoside triphosphate hydrolase protein [Fibularhizoctonia sp. CBS 109695]
MFKKGLSSSSADSSSVDSQIVQSTAANETVNVVVCGQAGVGKSSLINMLAGRAVAETSNDVAGCTSKSYPYPITMPGDRKITLWDTVGLDGWTTERVTALTATENIRKLTTQLLESTGLSLILYMVRGKPVGSVITDYLLFKAFCDDKVPFVLVVTGLDQDSDRVIWWEQNKSHFNQAGPLSDGHICIVSSKDLHNEEAYAESAREVFNLIEATCLRDPWIADRKSWFIQTVSSVAGVLLASTLKASQRSEILLDGLMQNGVPEDEARAVVRIFQRKYKSVYARSR